MNPTDPRFGGLPRGRRRAAATLPAALTVLGIINLAPNPALGIVFIVAALAGVAWMLLARPPSRRS
jgi:hypothetical protein